MTLRTLFWLAGCAFLVAACGSFVAYLRFELPFWALAVALGTLVAAVVLVLEWACAVPVEHLGRVSGRSRGGVPLLPAPLSRFSPRDLNRLWRGLRMVQDAAVQARRAQDAAEAQRGALQAHVRLLARASWALKPGAPLQELLPSLLADLAEDLGAQELCLVPLEAGVGLPVLGGCGRPAWGDALRASGVVPWAPLFAQDAPALLSLSPLAPEWRRHWEGRALWVVPLSHHGTPVGLLMSDGAGAERAWTPEEWTLLQALAPILAAVLHLAGTDGRARRGAFAGVAR